MNFLTCSAPWAKCSKDAGWRAPRSGLVYQVHISCSSRIFDNLCISPGLAYARTLVERGVSLAGDQAMASGIRYLASHYPTSRHEAVYCNIINEMTV